MYHFKGRKYLKVANTIMNEDNFHFKTKLLKESSSFCIESLLSNKCDEDRKVEVRSSPSPLSPSSTITTPFAPILPGFAPAPASSLPPSPHHHHLLHPPPPHLEHLLKQELFQSKSNCLPGPDLYTSPSVHSLPLELLARSGLFYQNFPNFAGT